MSRTVGPSWGKLRFAGKNDKDQDLKYCDNCDPPQVVTRNLYYRRHYKGHSTKTKRLIPVVMVDDNEDEEDGNGGNLSSSPVSNNEGPAIQQVMACTLYLLVPFLSMCNNPYPIQLTLHLHPIRPYVGSF